MESNSERVERRNRQPVSCEPCRQRKLKCNRNLPCGTCTKRNKQTECQYTANTQRIKYATPSKQTQLRDKLKHLEDLVSSLLSDQEPHQVEGPTKTHKPNLGSAVSAKTLEHSTGIIEEEQPGETPRPILGQNGQIHYVDRSHWQSILEEIKEMRDQLLPNAEFVPDSRMKRTGTGMDQETAFVFGNIGPGNLDDILSALPSQQICDSLLAHYFNTNHTILAIIHPEQFRTQYQKFWAAPSSVDPLWLAQLFALLSMATSLHQMAKGDNDSLPELATMQHRTSQCLVLGNYATANAFVLETFLLYLQSYFLTNQISLTHLWLKMGHVVQLAFRMAYHRDPSTLPNITVFDGEIRRRVWLNILQIDTLASFQVGFPSMILLDHCDTQLPGNYEYSDLYPGMQTLPPPRPLSTRTPVLYTISKARIMDVFKKISQHTQSLAPTTYDRTLALDLEMREAYTKIPELLTRRDVSQSYMDPTNLIWERCTIEILYLKSLIVLHRRYIRHELGNPRYELSRRYCVDAALDMLARQTDISQACQPGGRLYEDRRMLSSLTIHDFLLSSMVICLDLSVRMGKGSASQQALDELAANEVEALKISHSIWDANSSLSSDASIAARTLETMIRAVESRDAKLSPDQNTEPHSGQTWLNNNIELPHAGTVIDMINGSEPLDWPLLDQYFQQTGSSVNMEEPWDIGTEALF